MKPLPVSQAAKILDVNLDTLRNSGLSGGQKVVLVGVTAVTVAFTATVAVLKVGMVQPNDREGRSGSGGGGQVLASSTSPPDLLFNVNVKSKFADEVVIEGDLTAPNILYGLTAGTGIEIGTGQTPTVTNTDLGSAQKIFKTIKVGSTTFDAGSNTDTLTFAGGTGISISSSTTDKKLTIAASGSDLNVSGFTDDGTMVRLTTAGDIVSIGSATGSAKLAIEGGGTDRDIITASQSGNLLFKLTNAGNITAGTWQATAIGAIYGGTSQTSWTTGDILYASATNTLSKLGIGSSSQVLIVSGGVPAWSSTAGGGSGSGTFGWWQRNLGVLSPANIGDNLAIGGTATSSALLSISGTTGRFLSALIPETGSLYDIGSSARRWATVYGDTGNFTNLSSSTTSISGTTAEDFLINSDYTGSDAQDSTLTFERGAPATNSQFKWNSSATTKYLSSNAPFAVLPDTGIAAGGTAALIINQPFSQDILSASASGTTRFTLTNAGNITAGTWQATAIGAVYGGTGQASWTTGDILYASAANALSKLGIGSTNQVLTVSGGLPGWAAASGGWTSSGGNLYPTTTTDKVVIGGNTSTVHFLEVSGKQTGKALMALNETGDQNILVASASGTSRFTLSNAGALTASGNINSSGGALQTNSITRVDNSGNVTAALVTATGRVTVDNAFFFQEISATELGLYDSTGALVITFDEGN